MSSSSFYYVPTAFVQLAAVSSSSSGTGSSQWTRWQQSESPIVTPLPPINHIKADSSYQSTHKPDHGLTRDQRHQICSLDCVKELKHDDNLFHSSWRICKACNLFFGLQRLRDLEFIINALGIWVLKWYDICACQGSIAQPAGWNLVGRLSRNSPKRCLWPDSSSPLILSHKNWF